VLLLSVQQHCPLKTLLLKATVEALCGGNPGYRGGIPKDFDLGGAVGNYRGRPSFLEKY
jgi:hypothetical protein